MDSESENRQDSDLALETPEGAGEQGEIVAVESDRSVAQAAEDPVAPAAVTGGVVAGGNTAKPAVEVRDEEEDEEENSSVLPPLDPKRASYPWYVVHTYSGYEVFAKKSLEERIRSRGLTEKFGNVLVPQETVEELVRGTKKTTKKKVFPGYILVQVNLDDETWHLVRETPKITGFVGDSRNPSPLAQSEVEALVRQMEGGAQRPRVRVHFEQGDAVKVVDGPFADFNGTVDEVKPDKGKLRVLISIFGRNTPVELDFVQVEKV